MFPSGSQDTQSRGDEISKKRIETSILVNKTTGKEYQLLDYFNKKELQKPKKEKINRTFTTLIIHFLPTYNDIIQKSYSRYILSRPPPFYFV